MSDLEPTTEIVFDEGEQNINRSPYELTKKQIWYKCFQRCFDEGSKQQGLWYDKYGVLINQAEVFINSVNMFHTMALGTLMLKRHEELMEKIRATDILIEQEESNRKQEYKDLVEESNKPITIGAKTKIDFNKCVDSLNQKTSKNMFRLYREKLAVLSVLMENEQYLDARGGIND